MVAQHDHLNVDPSIVKSGAGDQSSHKVGSFGSLSSEGYHEAFAAVQHAASLATTHPQFTSAQPLTPKQFQSQFPLFGFGDHDSYIQLAHKVLGDPSR